MTKVARFIGALASTVTILIAGCGTGYQKVDGEWSWVSIDEGRGRTVEKLGADNATFEVLGNRDYGKDKNRVFYRTRPIDQADPATFEVLSNPMYSADSERVFVRGHMIPGADRKTFHLIKEPYGRDASAIYCGTLKMNVYDRDAFEVVSELGYWSGSDGKQLVFEFGDEFKDVSKDAGAVIGVAWARDGKAYYYGPARIEGADYSSFQIVGTYEARDKNRVFTGAFPTDEWPNRRKKILGLP
jgi:hypothetical protein